MGEEKIKIQSKREKEFVFIAMYAIMYINGGSYECNYSDKNKGKSL